VEFISASAGEAFEMIVRMIGDGSRTSWCKCSMVGVYNASNEALGQRSQSSHHTSRLVTDLVVFCNRGGRWWT
jgi:hypothetical protein